MQIVGSRPSADARRIRQFAARNRLPHVFLDVEYRSRPPRHPRPPRRQRRRRPDRGHAGRRGAAQPVQCGARKGRRVRERPGAGHRLRRRRRGRRAGLAASVYTASEGLATATIDGSGVGGQIGTTSRIENYLGFPVGVSGDEFAERAVVQVLRFGATLLVPAAAVGLSPQGHGYAVEPRWRQHGARPFRDRRHRRQVPTARRDRPRAFRRPRGVLHADRRARRARPRGRGSHRRRGQLGRPGGDIPRRPRARGHRRGPRGDLRASMSEYLIERIAEQRAIEVLCHCAVEAVEGRGRLNGWWSATRSGVGAPSRQRAVRPHRCRAAHPVGAGRLEPTATGSSSPVRSAAPPRSDDRRGTAWSAARTSWRPTCPGCSPRVTCAAARSSVLHQQSVKGPSPPIS